MININVDKKLVYYPLDTFVSPFFCKYDIHPNYVTIFTLLLNIKLYLLLKNYKLNKINIIIILYSMCYLDCLDGSIAVNCDKYTELGGFLDTICDNIRWAILFSFFLYKYFKLRVFNFYFIYFMFFVIFYIEEKSGFNLFNHNINNNFIKFFMDNSIISYSIIIFLIII